MIGKRVMKPKILILIGRYLPGYKDGGPIRTISNMIELNHDSIDFYIVTKDRDRSAKQSYPNIKLNEFQKVNHANVLYYSGRFKINYIKDNLNEYDAVYICGPYDWYAIRTVNYLKRKDSDVRVYIASMGTFSVGAIKIKGLKKRLFFRVTKIIGLFNNIEWIVSSESEAKDLINVYSNAKYFVVINPPSSMNCKIKPIDGENVKKNIVFISRITRKKNLSFAIDILEKISHDIIFDIYGPIEDKNYWNECKNKLKKLPKNISWEYKGVVNPVDLCKCLSGYHVFLFPTKGENFGHVIYEAMSSGCIPVISDQTLWLDKEIKRIGCVCNLSSLNDFVSNLNSILNLNDDELIQRRLRAQNYMQNFYFKTKTENSYRKLFSRD